jgi:hypothetical protein
LFEPDIMAAFIAYFRVSTDRQGARGLCLDRRARNIAFISTLMENGTDFVAVDMPTREPPHDSHPRGRRGA